MNVLANSELHMEWISFHAYWTKPLHAITSVNLNLYWDDLPSSFPSPLETEIGTGWAREMRSFECYKISRVSLAFEKAMAPHSSPLAWRIPWMEKPGGLQSTGSLGVGHDWSDLAACASFFKKIILLHRVLVVACWTFRCSSRTLFAVHGLNCSSACGILVPLPGIKPACSALQGRFLTTGPPGKSQIRGFKTGNIQYCSSRCKRMRLGSQMERHGALLDVGALPKWFLTWSSSPTHCPVPPDCDQRECPWGFW